MSSEPIQRSILPIPDRRPISLTTFEAKDPDTKFPPITPLRPPDGVQITMAAASPRAEKFLCIWTAKRRVKARRANRTVCLRWGISGRGPWGRIARDDGDDNNHLITPEEQFMVAMAKQ